ncbi:MAG TPA: hypothetical protein VGY32_03520, partial [Solirubrobacteraceae bacterium]|nr:hypothetical protein [Solirubrobacteraceae bacterium]
MPPPPLLALPPPPVPPPPPPELPEVGPGLPVPDPGGCGVEAGGIEELWGEPDVLWPDEVRLITLPGVATPAAGAAWTTAVEPVLCPPRASGFGPAAGRRGPPGACTAGAPAMADGWKGLWAAGRALP